MPQLWRRLGVGHEESRGGLHAVRSVARQGVEPGLAPDEPRRQNRRRLEADPRCSARNLARRPPATSCRTADGLRGPSGRGRSQAGPATPRSASTRRSPFSPAGSPPVLARRSAVKGRRGLSARGDLVSEYGHRRPRAHNKANAAQFQPLSRPVPARTVSGPRQLLESPPLHHGRRGGEPLGGTPPPASLQAAPAVPCVVRALLGSESSLGQRSLSTPAERT